MTATASRTPTPRVAIGHVSRTAVIGAGLAARLAGRAARLSNNAYWAAHSGNVQRAQLRRLLRAAAHTEFGRRHSFARLARLSDRELPDAYARAVPVRDYEAFRSTIARMREGGESDLLWPGFVRDFAQTSGTTAGDKYMPVSAAMLASNFRASLDIFAHLMRMGVSLPRLLSGKLLFLGGSTQLTHHPCGTRTGDLSGVVTDLIQWPISEVYSPGPEVALLSHWPTKLEAMARQTLTQDVRFLSGMPSWSLALFDRLLARARDAGRPASCIRDIWPNLTVFVHGGVKYDPFDARVRHMWSGTGPGGPGDDIPVRFEVYPASEAFVAMQDQRGSPSLRLLTDHANYLEFVPLERINDPDPEAFPCDRVEAGQKYVVVLSTCAGLWRYILGDVVEFDTFCSRSPADPGQGPPRLRIVGRHKHFINAFGENLIVEHIERAVAHAARVTGADIGEFSAAPVYPSASTRAGLELVVELAPPTNHPLPNHPLPAHPTTPDAPLPASSRPVLEAFREAFDASLKAQNVDYTTKRTDSVGMAPPTITVVRPGTFHTWMQRRGKLGGQHKCPRCANHRQFVDAVLDVARSQ